MKAYPKKYKKKDKAFFSGLVCKEKKPSFLPAFICLLLIGKLLEEYLAQKG